MVRGNGNLIISNIDAVESQNRIHPKWKFRVFLTEQDIMKGRRGN